MSYETNELFLASIELGMTKESSAADTAARELLEGALSGVRRVGNQAKAPKEPGFFASLFSAAGPSRKYQKGAISDDVLSQAQNVLGQDARSGLRGEIEMARQNILDVANKRVASNALVGGGVGGVAGAATADQGEGAQGFLRGVALGGLGGAALGGRQASKIRKQLGDEFASAGVNAKELGNWARMGDLNRTIKGHQYNPLKTDVTARIRSGQDLRRGLSNLADDVSGQAFSPIGAATAGAVGGVGGTVAYNAGERYMNKHLGGNNQGSQPRRPPMGPPPPPMMPPRMPPPPPQMPYPMYGYYPYGGR